MSRARTAEKKMVTEKDRKEERVTSWGHMERETETDRERDREYTSRSWTQTFYMHLAEADDDISHCLDPGRSLVELPVLLHISHYE